MFNYDHKEKFDNMEDAVEAVENLERGTKMKIYRNIKDEYHLAWKEDPKYPIKRRTKMKFESIVAEERENLADMVRDYYNNPDLEGWEKFSTWHDIKEENGHVVKLNLRQNRYDNRALEEYIVNFPELKNLNIHHNELTDIEPLLELDNLEKVDIESNPAVEEDKETISKLEERGVYVNTKAPLY